MSDLIKRQDAIMALKLEYPMMPMFKELREEWAIKTEGYHKAEEIIMSLPSAEPPNYTKEINIAFQHGLEEGVARTLCADRPQGEWIFKTVFPNDESEFPMGYLVCSVCGSHHSNSTPCNYCDTCGARMKGADDEDN